MAVSPPDAFIKNFTIRTTEKDSKEASARSMDSRQGSHRGEVTRNRIVEAVIAIA
jgi:hypothetical protein